MTLVKSVAKVWVELEPFVSNVVNWLAPCLQLGREGGRERDRGIVLQCIPEWIAGSVLVVLSDQL